MDEIAFISPETNRSYEFPIAFETPTDYSIVPDHSELSPAIS
jgi:hypothetical protein